MRRYASPSRRSARRIDRGRDDHRLLNEFEFSALPYLRTIHFSRNWDRETVFRRPPIISCLGLDRCDDARADRTAALADREAQAFLARDRRDQLDVHRDVV